MLMKKLIKMLAGVLIGAGMMCAGLVNVYAVEIDGLGTKSSPYIIENEEQLLAIVTKELPANAYYELNNDISLVTKSWTPIGANVTTGFTGSFDGKGHTIANLNIGDTTNNYSNVGLFALNAGNISNLNVEAGSLKLNDSKKTTMNVGLGVIAGRNTGKIDNCSVSGSLLGIKTSNTTMSACFVKLGGVAGINEGTISGCQSACSVDASSDYIGGIAGYSGGSISGCDFTGTIGDELNTLTARYMGGIAGYSVADISTCRNLSDITCNTADAMYASNVGGVVGYINNATISQCYNLGDISGGVTGGLVGYCDNSVQVENSYSVGNVSGSRAGGLIGSNSSSKYVKNSYCSGSVKGESGVYADAFAYGTSKNYSNCFYNKGKESTAESVNAYGLTETEMQNSANFTFWDFNTVWGINSNVNNGYPYLRAMVQGVTEIQLSDTSLTMLTGDTKQLTATILPETATNKNYTWTSTDSSVASVSDTGLVTANGVGNTTIVVTASDNGATATCAVKVVTENDVDETAIIRVDNVTTIPGQRISVPVRLTKNSAGICTLGIDIKYDNTYLKPVADTVNVGSVFPDLISNTKYGADTIRITSSSTVNRTGSGIICYLEFDVSADAPVSSSDITVEVNELKTLSGNTQMDLDYIVYNGTVNVEDCMLGDVNGDGQITAADATEVLLGYAGLKSFTVREMTAADIDKNSEITASDATEILLKYAGYNVQW